MSVEDTQPPAPEPEAPVGEESFADAEAPPQPEPAEAPAGVDAQPTSSAGTDGSPAGVEEAPAAVEEPVTHVEEPVPHVEEAPGEVDYLMLAQRTQADFDNFRKRAAREAALAGERSVGRVAKELLPALDHLELALQAVEQDPAHAEIAKGLRLVQDELVKALGRVGVQPFSPGGEAFDPTEHEAMTQMPVEGFASGTVAQVYQAGYRLNGSVLRPARVVVAA